MKNLKKKGFTNSKGFTIVELVIVIAVIAILSAVLIPTFSNLTEKANDSAAIQESANEYKLYLSEIAAKGEEAPKNLLFVVKNGENVKALVLLEGSEYTVLKENNKNITTFSKTNKDATFGTSNYKLVIGAGENTEATELFSNLTVEDNPNIEVYALTE